MELYPTIEAVVQESDIRCFTNNEYRNYNIPVTDNLLNCNILLGIKEVDINFLIPRKIYIFFSHTAKEQPYNKKLLQEIIKRKITLIDYEYLTDTNNSCPISKSNKMV